MEHDLRRLIYSSRSLLCPKFEFEELYQIIETARRFNEGHDITGALILVKGCFAQILEGPSATVDSLMQSIAGDERHTQVTIIQVENDIQRHFPNWSMAYPVMIFRSANDLHEVLEKSLAGDKSTGPYIQDVMQESKYEEHLTQSSFSGYDKTQVE